MGPFLLLGKKCCLLHVIAQAHRWSLTPGTPSKNGYHQNMGEITPEKCTSRKCGFPWLKPCGSYESNYLSWVANLNPTMPSFNSQVTVLRQERSRSKCRPVQVSSRFISRQFQESKVSSWQRVLLLAAVSGDEARGVPMNKKAIGGFCLRMRQNYKNFPSGGRSQDLIHMWMSWLTHSIYSKKMNQTHGIHVWYIYLRLP